jgi:enamine deaminase RidA (YjgF/YER057c/UK114 family)
VTPEERFARLGLELPPAPGSVGVYKLVVVHNGLAYVSGHGPRLPDGSLTKGRVGDNLDVAAGYQAARQTGLTMLATLRAEFQSLNAIARLVKTFGLVHAAPEFTEHPAVINGFSELMREVFGEDNGVAARSAVGAVSLPAGMAVEVEAVFELAR